MQQSCDLLAVSRSGFYAAQHRSAKPASCKASIHLKAAFMASHQSYGSRRLVTAMANAGVQLGRFKVRRLMRQAALKPVWKRKFVHTTDSKHGLPVAANVLNRQFNPVGAESRLRQRYHLHSDRCWMALPGHCPRLVCTQSGRLGHGAEHARPAGLRCIEHGDRTTTAGARTDRPFGSGQSICQRAVPGDA